ncbi:MAG: helix-turn-helix domain-containing protein, partial [Chitinophagaceae bacterium]
HRHSFFHLVLFTKGAGWHTIDFEKFDVVPYQVYFMRPGQVHSWHFEGEAEGYIVHFNEALFAAYLQNGHYLERLSFFQGTAADSICQLPAKEQVTATAIFETILQEMETGEEQNLDMIRLKLLEFFIRVERLCGRKVKANVPPQKLTVLRGFQNLIDKHFRELKLPKDYAELLYVTPNHLNALCQDLLGRPAGDLIRDRVLLEAKRLLTNADMTVAEIAYDLNFGDNSYFSRFFKKNVGVTPEGFRKKFLQQ